MRTLRIADRIMGNPSVRKETAPTLPALLPLAAMVSVCSTDLHQKGETMREKTEGHKKKNAKKNGDQTNQAQ